VGDYSHFVSGQKFTGANLSVRRYFVAQQQLGLLSSKFAAKSFAYFHVVAVNVTLVCGIDCFVCQDEFFVNNPLDVNENYEHALDFAIHLSRI
jgi:hypothetical protein